MGLRVRSTLSEDLEILMRQTIGACLTVHRELGPGLLEAVYLRAVARELTSRGIPFELEHSVPIKYRGAVIAQHRLDVFVDRRVILEAKSVDRLAPIHVAQVISYLRATRTRAALLVNFNVPILKQGLRRIVL